MQQPTINLSAALVAALTALDPVPPPPPLPQWMRDFLGLRTSDMTIDEVLQSQPVWEYVKCIATYPSEPATLTIIEKAAEISPSPVMASNDLPDGW
ncbi:hypothetical protein [Herpetosiphon geysericola]|uniref:Uncharacterized protein n=1 Tax=Herpetosiphon geysericola TaxID=70996 RepID=A0A0P6YXR0_9CHLR|nr:hypothetical protein [Herpetosiphon geysericola]KPL90022.1 hypothetical protein SE18_08705 [Herpetosiphon geysericola]